MSVALIAIVALALAFDFINGFHDAANSIATVVSTRVLSPRMAVLWAAAFNFIAFMVFETTVAAASPKASTRTWSRYPRGRRAGGGHHLGPHHLVAGLPTSSSHALLGGLAGAAILKAGFGSLDAAVFPEDRGLHPGLADSRYGARRAAHAALIVLFGSRSPSGVDRTFRRLQLGSAALYSLGHGGNDAQKTMGIIVAALVATGHQIVPAGAKPSVPFWVVLACHAAMGLGTLSGGWRIVRTMGMRITKLAPVGGFCAETSGAATLFLATFLGIPVSTDPHHHRLDRRYRQRANPIGSSMGRRRPNRLGLGADRAGSRADQRSRLLGRREPRTTALAGRSTLERALFTAHFEAISAVDGLDVEHFATCNAKDSLHRRRNVFVHAVGELDDDDRTLAGGANQAARDRARTPTQLAEYDLHSFDASTSPRGV